MTSKFPFRWRHYRPEIILLCVRWYLRYPLSYRDLAEMMRDRGLTVVHTTIYRWVMAYAPEINKRCRKHLKITNDSWKVDETYIKVKGKWKYLYRAIDKNGNTIDFLLCAKRNAKAAARFLQKALKGFDSVNPRVINTDKDKAYPKALEDLTESGSWPKSTKHRAVKYLNNLIEQDHRYITRRVIASQYFREFWSAYRTISGYEGMNMIRKGQIQNVERSDILGQLNYLNSLFGIAGQFKEKMG
ncbi:MAG: IS6 family transposase [Cyanobacteria bacterium P01_G01_bin.67]